jgi:putative transposase
MQIAIIILIERTHHHRRRQEAIGRLTPVEFESIMTTPASLAG